MITGIAGCRTDQTECESAMYLIEVTKLPIASGTGATLATTAANPKASARSDRRDENSRQTRGIAKGYQALAHDVA